MLVNIHHDNPAEHRRLLVAGVGLLTVIAMLVGLSVAIYAKAFDDVTMVTIKADRAGLQLAKFGDVRVNGALVGQVREISQDGEEAEIRIALEPAAAREIPSNVEVQILPTTLFGQKFVSLVAPHRPSPASLQENDVIPSDRVETNVELNRILSNLFPLLRSVRPADLNTTLNALATALGGRGEKLGVTLEKLDSYLGAIEDDLPTLREDLVLLAEVADTYEVAAPDLLGVLDNLTVTSRTVIDQRRELDVFFGDVAGLARTSTTVLEENEQNLIAVGELSAPLMRLLAAYSPEYPCLLRGLANYQPRLAEVFRGNMIRQFFVFNTPQYREYDERDAPVYGEVGHGPWCLGLPNPPEPIAPQPLDDGTDMDDNPPTSTTPGTQPSRSTGSGFAGSEGEQAIINALLASRSGRPVDSYGALGPLMYGPVVRGGEALS
jgi:phospholipid/cholesterol/gamma-HCH transport system substrate-binding protein